MSDKSSPPHPTLSICFRRHCLPQFFFFMKCTIMNMKAILLKICTCSGTGKCSSSKATLILCTIASSQNHCFESFDHILFKYVTPTHPWCKCRITSRLFIFYTCIIFFFVSVRVMLYGNVWRLHDLYIWKEVHSSCIQVHNHAYWEKITIFKLFDFQIQCNYY